MCAGGLRSKKARGDGVPAYPFRRGVARTTHSSQSKLHPGRFVPRAVASSCRPCATRTTVHVRRLLPFELIMPSSRQFRARRLPRRFALGASPCASSPSRGRLLAVRSARVRVRPLAVVPAHCLAPPLGASLAPRPPGRLYPSSPQFRARRLPRRFALGASPCASSPSRGRLLAVRSARVRARPLAVVPAHCLAPR